MKRKTSTKAKPANVCLSYMYRDADNYKNSGEVIFANKTGVPVQELEKSLREWLCDGEWFIADQIGIPEVFLYSDTADYDPNDESTRPDDIGPGHYVRNDADHCWHEFRELDETNEDPTDSRDIVDLIAQVRAVNQRWRFW